MNAVTITGTRNDRNRKVRVFLNTGLTLSLRTHVAAQKSLHKGQVISLDELGELQSADMLHCSMNSALKYLNLRPRSEAEVRARLNRNGFPDETTHQVITRLKELGLVDDAAFARSWKDNREAFKPQSRRLTRLELQKKGVAAEIIDDITADADDETAAYRAATKKINSLKGLDYPVFRRRLWSFLKQRGFDYGLGNRIINRAWEQPDNMQPD